MSSAVEERDDDVSDSIVPLSQSVVSIRPFPSVLEFLVWNWVVGWMSWSVPCQHPPALAKSGTFKPPPWAIGLGMHTFVHGPMLNECVKWKILKIKA